jgi:hypothetical protein
MPKRAKLTFKRQRPRATRKHSDNFSIRVDRISADGIPTAWAAGQPYLKRLFAELGVPAQLAEKLRQGIVQSGAFLWIVREQRTSALCGAFITGWDPQERIAAVLATEEDLRRWPALITQALRTTALITDSGTMVIIGLASLARIYAGFEINGDPLHGRVRLERSTGSALHDQAA